MNRVAHHGNIIIDAGEYLPRRRLIEIGNGKAGNFIRHRNTKFAGKAAGNDVVQRIHFQPGKQRIHRIDDGEHDKGLYQSLQECGRIPFIQREIADVPDDSAQKLRRKNVAGDDDQRHKHHADELKTDLRNVF